MLPLLRTFQIFEDEMFKITQTETNLYATQHKTKETEKSHKKNSFVQEKYGSLGN
jgi:hypothetical protein